MPEGTDRRPVMDYDKSLALLVATFEARHPRQALPKWFETSVFPDISLSGDGKLTLRYYACPFMGLVDGERWAKIGGGWVITSPDPKTHNEKITISRHYRDNLTLFKASADVFTGQIEVAEDVDLTSFDIRDIEHPPGSPCWYIAYDIPADA